MTDEVQLREVVQGDLSAFYEQQLDPEATAMAAFPSRDRDSFLAHWARILSDSSNTIRTILFDGKVAGNIVCFQQSGNTFIGYWLGKEYWGKGIATRALTGFLQVVTTRPLYAHVAKRNIGSIRVLQKCGFTPSTHTGAHQAGADAEIEELLFRLEGQAS